LAENFTRLGTAGEKHKSLQDARNMLRIARSNIYGSYMEGGTPGVFTTKALYANIDSMLQPYNDLIDGLEKDMNAPAKDLNNAISLKGLSIVQRNDYALTSAAVSKVFGRDALSLASGTAAGEGALGTHGVQVMSILSQVGNGEMGQGGITKNLRPGVSPKVAALSIEVMKNVLHNPETKLEGRKRIALAIGGEELGTGSYDVYKHLYTDEVQQDVLNAGDEKVVSQFHKGMIDNGESVAFREIAFLKPLIGSSPMSNGGYTFKTNAVTGELTVKRYSDMDERPGVKGLHEALKRYNKILLRLSVLERGLGSKGGEVVPLGMALGAISNRWLGGLLNRTDAD
jgi:hypothetical protein